jgi:hypothetical protein
VTAAIELTTEQAEELRRTLEAVLGELTQEIANTDNALYRRGLRERRDRLQEVLAAVPSK